MAPDGYLRGVLADGARPFRHRAGVRELLGQPPDTGVRVRFAAAAPRAGFSYLHRGGDRLAGRVVLQAFVGKLVLMAASDPTATLPDYLAAMWERVASYPLGRRRRRVAANLVLDTLKSVKSAGRQQGVELPGWDADTTPSRPRVEEAWGDIEEVLREGVELGAISELTRATLHSVYVEGRTSASAGRALGASAAAVRQRCSQGVRALRAIAPELIERLAS